VGLATFVTVAHQPGLFQDTKMLRDGRLRDPGPRRQSPNRLLAVAAQPLEESPPGRIGERSEQHIVSVRHLGIYNLLAMDLRITAEICISQAGTWRGAVASDDTAMVKS
jgi:hypothetical protein